MSNDSTTRVEEDDTTAFPEIVSLALIQLDLEREEIDLQEQIEHLRKRLYKLRTEDLPGAFDEAGVQAIVLDNGMKVTLADRYEQSLPKKNKAACAKWLQEHELGALVRSSAMVVFDKDEQELLEEAVDLLNENGFAPIVVDNMNTTSVKAALKSLLEQGEDVPTKMFGLHVFRLSTIKED